MARMRMITPYAVQLAPWSLESRDKPAWLEMRRYGLGGSDMPAVAGMSDRGSRWGVWLSKVAQEPADPDDGTRLEEMFWFGHQMEEVAARRFRMRHPGTRTIRCGMLAARHDPWMRVSLDYRVTGCPDGPCILEVKNRNAYASQEWDKDGDAEKVPDDAAIQVMWGLIVLGGPLAGYTHGHLLAVIGGNELREYRIDWDPALASLLIEEGRWFWHDHVLPKVPPPADAAERTGKILARLWDADEEAVMVATPDQAEVVTRLRAAKAGADKAGAELQRLSNDLMALMGEHEILLGATGKPLATWKQNSTFRDKEFRTAEPAALVGKYTVSRDVTDTKALAAADPRLYRKYRSRVLRVKPAPKD